MLIRVGLLFAIFLALSLRATSATEVARLDGNTVPVSYDLSLTPNLARTEIMGDETIAIRVNDPENVVALNWAGLGISSATLDGQPIPLESHKKIEQVWLRSTSAIASGAHLLHLSFTSRIYEMFASKAMWNAGSTGANPLPFLVTMFEPSQARFTFPSFDEPAFRAAITLHMTAPSEWTVVSNMPALSRVPQDGGMIRTDFAPSPPMPVYLLAIDAGPMREVAGESDGIPIHVYGAPQTEGLDIILQRAEKILHYYDDYLGVRYPLPKLDLIVAPGRFESALEQWGAITFYDEAEVTTGNNADPGRSQRDPFFIVAHEMGHQWFGDLVGMRWWGDAFVAEGITQWLSRRAVEDLEPSEPFFREAYDDIDWVMRFGVTAKSRSIVTTYATDLQEDDEVAFSGGVYDKSAAILRQWHSYIGEARFRAALQRYLRRYSGTAATFEEFWDSFNDPAARRYGEAWLKRPGFPVVSVALECVGPSQIAHVGQTPFLNGLGSPPGYRQQIWPIPFSIQIGLQRSHWYLMQRASATVGAGRCHEPISVDRSIRPYYRVRYPTDALRSASFALAPERFRLSFLQDAAALQQNGYVPADYFLRAASRVEMNDDPAIFHQIAFTYIGLLDALPPGKSREIVQESARAIFGQFFLREPKQSYAEIRPYDDALFVLSKSGDARFAEEAQKRLDIMLASGRPYDFTAALFLAEIAAAKAKSQNVASMEALMAKRPPQRISPGVTYYNEPYAYLVNIGSPALAEEVLQKYATDPALVFALSRRQPQVGWRFVTTHTRQLLSAVKPSQQAAFLATNVAQAFWFLPPEQVRSYLMSALGPYQRRVIDDAMKSIASRRHQGAIISAQVLRM